MKKQELKQQLLEASAKSAIQTTMIICLSEKLDDTKEALDRRRALYDRLANHSTIQKPKSMNEMAEALYLQFADNILEFKELSQDEQDKWMDRLLTILN